MSYHVCIRPNIMRRRYDDTSIDMGDGLVGTDWHGSHGHGIGVATERGQTDWREGEGDRNLFQGIELCNSELYSPLCLSLSLSLASSACPSFHLHRRSNSNSSPHPLPLALSLCCGNLPQQKASRSTQPPSCRYKLPHPLTSTSTFPSALLFSPSHFIHLLPS